MQRLLPLLVALTAGCAALPSPHTPIAPDRQTRALEVAVALPQADDYAALALATKYLAARSYAEGYRYFQQRADASPSVPIFTTLEGLFQARLADEIPLSRRIAWANGAISKLDAAVEAETEPGVTIYMRGLVLAEMPKIMKKTDAAIADLDFVIANKDKFPEGLLRNVHRAYAIVYRTLGRDAESNKALQRSGYASLDPDESASFTTDHSMTVAGVLRSRTPRLYEAAPGIFVASGYGFSEFAFVVTSDGVVAVDAGGDLEGTRQALAALREHTDLPITHVLLTHAHFDHIIGLPALVTPGVQVIGRPQYAEVLDLQNTTGTAFPPMQVARESEPLSLHIDRVIEARESITVGDTVFDLIPTAGGETEDTLFIHVPARDALFLGDALMPWVGAPFWSEGSTDGLIAGIRTADRLHAKHVIQGHPPLTALFGPETFSPLADALQEVDARSKAAIEAGVPLSQTLDENLYPEILHENPTAALAFIATRDHFIQRLYTQHTGYWKTDGAGVEVLNREQWAAGFDALAGGKERKFVRAAEKLYDGGDYVLAFKLADWGLAAHPGSKKLAEVRRLALDRLRESSENVDLFKTIYYSGVAGAAIPPPPVE